MSESEEMTADQERAAARRRSSAARIASHSSWANTDDRPSRTRPAREAFMNRFEREVDPDLLLAPEVRALKAESAMRAYMGRLGKSRHKPKKKPKGQRAKGANPSS